MSRRPENHHTPRKLDPLGARYELPREVKVRWNSSYDLGRGVDAVTGTLMGSALRPFDVPSHRIGEDPTRESGLRFISNLSEVLTIDEEGLSAAINVGLPERLGMSINHEELRKVSTSSCIIEYFVKGSYGFEKPPENSLSFTENAEKLLRDPKQFRKYYGDYFIFGYQRYYLFHAIISYREVGKSKESELKASVGLDSGAYGGVSGKFRRLRRDGHGYTVENVAYITSGLSPTQRASDLRLDTVRTGTKEDTLLSLLDSIQTMDFKGARQIALLRHYSTLCPTKLSRSISVRGVSGNLMTVLSELHGMDRYCLRLELDLCHSALGSIEKEAREIIKSFRMKRATLLYENNTREETRKKLKSIVAQANLLIKQANYIQHEFSIRPTPPGYGEQVRSSHANAAWRYGITGCKELGTVDMSDGTLKQVRIYSTLCGREVLLKYKGHFFKNFKRGIISFITPTYPATRRAEEYAPDPVAGRDNYHLQTSWSKITILGFTVTFNNREGREVKFEVSKGGLLKDSLVIHITSIPSGCVCHCRITYLDGKASEYGLAG